jgi:2-dehydro-3-deoxyphosphooctonate aldolase (KDO 8-P synthase)
MMIKITERIGVGNESPLVIFGGINVLESMELALRTCEEFVRVTEKLALP